MTNPLVPNDRVTRQTHDFWPHAGGICRKEVERPNGAIEECGEPVRSPVHDPAAYLAYRKELHKELATWTANKATIPAVTPSGA